MKLELFSGFCKNDNNLERNVNLLVEAFIDQSNNSCPNQKAPDKIGEGHLIVFPRADVPHKQIPAFAGREIYSMTDVMSLDWIGGEKKNASNNFGHIKFSAVLMYSMLKAANPDLDITTEKQRVNQMETLEKMMGLSPVKEELIQVSMIAALCQYRKSITFASEDTVQNS